jgi:hypothetical protein
MESNLKRARFIDRELLAVWLLHNQKEIRERYGAEIIARVSRMLANGEHL